MPSSNVVPDQVVLWVGDEPFTILDVIGGARLRGEWAEGETRTREGLACARRAQRDGDPISQQELTDAANRFRYERGLLAAEDAEAWLAERGLDVPAWVEGLRRGLLREHWADELPQTLAHFAAEESQVQAECWSEAVCSGALDQACEELAARAAVFAAERAGRPWPPRDRGALPKRMETVFAGSRKRALGPDRLRACLHAHRLAWMRFRGQRVELPTEPMAREVRLRVLEDGEPMESIAAELRVPCQSWEGFAEELEPELAPCLSGAPVGQLVGPISLAEGFTLFRLAARVPPDLDDPSVRQRVEDAVWQATVRGWIEEHVRWEIHV